MQEIDVKIGFEPKVLNSGSRNEVNMIIEIGAMDAKPHWCECDINVTPPISLAHDKELGMGRTRVGIVSAGKRLSKHVKVYTSPSVTSGNYQIGLVVYLYDEDGAIAARKEVSEAIACGELSKEEMMQ